MLLVPASVEDTACGPAPEQAVACVLDKLPKRTRFQYWENEHASDARSQKLKTRTHRMNTLIFILKGAKIMNTSVIVRCTLIFEQLKGWPKEVEENTNCDFKEETKEEEITQSKSTVLCKFVEESVTKVPDIVINPQQVSKKQRDVFKELFYKQLDTKFGGKLGTTFLTAVQYNTYVEYL
jgi:hypothetical protein